MLLRVPTLLALLAAACFLLPSTASAEQMGEPVTYANESTEEAISLTIHVLDSADEAETIVHRTASKGILELSYGENFTVTSIDEMERKDLRELDISTGYIARMSHEESDCDLFLFSVEETITSVMYCGDDLDGEPIRDFIRGAIEDGYDVSLPSGFEEVDAGR